MAHPIVVPGSAQVRLIWSMFSAVTMYNVLGASKPGGVTINQTLANSLGSAIKSAVSSSGYVGHIHPQTVLVAVGVRDTSVANSPEFIDSGAGVPGSATGDALARQVALVVSLKTARAGQSYRGRVYLGGFTEADNDPNGGPLPALQTAAVAFVVAIQSAIATAGMSLAVLSRPGPAVLITTQTTWAGESPITSAKSIKARPGAVTPVTSITMRNPIWDAQRRRTSAGGGSTRFAPMVSFDVESGLTTDRTELVPFA